MTGVDLAPLAALVAGLQRENRDLAAAAALWQERARTLGEQLKALGAGDPGPQDAPSAPPQPPGATAGTGPPFAPSVAAWRARTTRAVDVDAPEHPPPWWRFWARRR